MDGPSTPAAFCRGLLARRRRDLAAGQLHGADLAAQPAYERILGYFAARDVGEGRFREVIEERFVATKDDRVAAACSAILSAWADPGRRRALARLGGEPDHASANGAGP